MNPPEAIIPLPPKRFNPLKRIDAFFKRPERHLHKLSSDFWHLATELYTIESGLMRDDDFSIDMIVSFFQLTSWWSDRGLGDVTIAFKMVNDGQYDDVITELMLLDMEFIVIGRSPYGMNRTLYGEEVTPEKIFLWDTSGLSAQSVAYWFTQRHEPKDTRHLNPYDIVSKQARDFMMHPLPCPSPSRGRG